MLIQLVVILHTLKPYTIANQKMTNINKDSSKQMYLIFIIVVMMSMLFVVIEASVGFYENSMSLLSDAGHNLRDVLSLLLVLISFRLAKIKRNKQFTYGYKKSTILISLVNAVILIIAVVAIIIENVKSLDVPDNVNGMAVSWTAALGIVINSITAFLLAKGQKNDINIRGVFLHKLADAVVSVGVFVSGIIITLTGFNFLDRIVSLVIAVVILIPSVKLLIESLRLSLDGIPRGISIDHIEDIIRNTPHIIDVHHIHIWPLSTTENAFTAHIIIDDLAYMESAKTLIKQELELAGINHITIEFENSVCHCDEIKCKNAGIN